jgi:hypothetical protein
MLDCLLISRRPTADELIEDDELERLNELADTWEDELDN